MQEEARKLVKEAEANQEKAEKCQKEVEGFEKGIEKALNESEHAHHQGNRFDWGELSVEFAVVLCSVAVLTKLRGFWYTGIVMGTIGAVIALSAFILH